MLLKERIQQVLDLLDVRYGQAPCSLLYEKDYELLIATRLSAQCTDARVNLVTPTLFSTYPSLEALASAKLEDVEDIVRPCGFFHTKAQNIIDMSRMLLEQFDGKVPGTIEELTTLPGIGRKTANLICGDIYGKPAIVADTHCIRITNRLGFCKNLTDPYKVELRLKKIIPPARSNNFCHQLVLFGREVCSARKPKCDICELASYCDYFHKSKKA